jgi:hypothetical protein
MVSGLRLVAVGALVVSSAAIVCCAEIVGVDTVTFSGPDATPLHDATVEQVGKDARHDTGSDAHEPPPDAPLSDSTESESLPVEGECPVCGGKSCCSPQHCFDDRSLCCSSRAGPCTKNSDCCDDTCDVDAGRCGGPCLPEGSGSCVLGADCCKGHCNSAGFCRPCGGQGRGCTSDTQCCFGLSCTSTKSGTCEMM